MMLFICFCRGYGEWRVVGYFVLFLVYVKFFLVVKIGCVVEVVVVMLGYIGFY